jgi:hypothetical protein
MTIGSRNIRFNAKALLAGSAIDQYNYTDLRNYILRSISPEEIKYFFQVIMTRSTAAKYAALASISNKDLCTYVCYMLFNEYLSIDDAISDSLSFSLFGVSDEDKARDELYCFILANEGFTVLSARSSVAIKHARDYVVSAYYGKGVGDSYKDLDNIKDEFSSIFDVLTDDEKKISWWVIHGTEYSETAGFPDFYESFERINDERSLVEMSGAIIRASAILNYDRIDSSMDTSSFTNSTVFPNGNIYMYSSQILAKVSMSNYTHLVSALRKISSRTID